MSLQDTKGKLTAATGSIAALLAAKQATANNSSQPATNENIVTGMTSSVNMVQDASKIVQPVLARPVRDNENQTLFVRGVSTRLGFVPEDGKRYSFDNGFFLTDNQKLVEHIKANAEGYGVVETEEGPLKKEEKKEEKK